MDARTLAANVGAVRRLLAPSVALCAVVKGNAFGHGLAGAAAALAAGGADAFAVDSLEEALALRAAGCALPLLVMCPPTLVLSGHAGSLTPY